MCMLQLKREKREGECKIDMIAQNKYHIIIHPINFYIPFSRKYVNAIPDFAL